MTGQRRPPARRRRELPEPFVWHDVAVLRTYLSDRGKIRSRRVSGLSAQQHRLVARAVKSAREMALLPCPTSRR
ncbi:30S ribosomal protein S18 [Trujillonella humicola]|uniref:30S ribosomal protein S18 n=1 Tax=Trujillonella humicola TaxID=3383699 RepID=UPI0039061FD9